MNPPASTYRLQLHKGFTLDDAAATAPGLARLGATHLYLSPILQSAPGSPHGYDGVDPTRIDSERGGREAFDRLLKVCRALDLAIVLDIVPNHLCVSSPMNAWWRSALRLGRASPWSAMFDIDWDSPRAPGRILLPALGAPLDAELRSGAIQLTELDGEIGARYHEHAWPLRPASAGEILHGASAGLRADLSALGERFARLDADAPDRPDGPVLESRLGDATAQLAALLRADERAAAALADELERASTPDRLKRILDAQHYLLMDWREGSTCVNYRRFFDVNELAALRIEDERVFEAAHALILELAQLPGVDGLRVDHPDGLRDPKAYFERLASRAPGAWIVAEKILERDEALPSDWPVAGSTGYDFLNDALAVLCDAHAEPALTDLHVELVGDAAPFAEVALKSKRAAAATLLRADLDRLTRLAQAALTAAGAPAFTDETIAHALVEITAHLPVYRTYYAEAQRALGDTDRRLLEAAAQRAKERSLDAGEDAGGAAIDAVAQLLLTPRATETARELMMRFQQLTAPVAAKGVEDTAFYRHSRFVAVNEVGGDPLRIGMSASAFHARVQARAANWPDSMLATSTHDTKRSEDVRARLAVLTETPRAWAAHARQWMGIARRLGPRQVADSDAYFLLQTLAGAWPIEIERMQAHMRKAAREAKLRTSWTDINEAYERALLALVDRLYSDAAFIASLEAIVARIRRPGRVKSLAQVALRLSCPGVADTYQGCELWNSSLVDPDNRRPVDFELRDSLLARLETMTLESIWASLEDAEDPGLSKLWLTRTLLHQRRRRPDVFSGRGGYAPLSMSGEHGDRAIALGRGGSKESPAFITVAPLRSLHPIADCALELPGAPTSAWTNLCTGERVVAGGISVDSLLSSAPVALLADEEALA